MRRKKFLYYPVASETASEGENPPVEYVIGDAPCPCCQNITIPNHGDALAYICPFCYWEIDLFLRSDAEHSDQNHGLTLRQARENYHTFGAVLPALKQYCRPPKPWELPESE